MRNSSLICDDQAKTYSLFPKAEFGKDNHGWSLLMRCSSTRRKQHYGKKDTREPPCKFFSSLNKPLRSYLRRVQGDLTRDYRSLSKRSHRSDDGHPKEVLWFQDTRDASQFLMIHVECRQWSYETADRVPNVRTCLRKQQFSCRRHLRSTEG